MSIWWVQEAVVAAADAARHNAVSCITLNKQISGIDTLAHEVDSPHYRVPLCIAFGWNALRVSELRIPSFPRKTERRVPTLSPAQGFELYFGTAAAMTLMT